MIEREKSFESPLDRRNGRVPSWAEVSTKFGLTNLPRGEKKLFQAFYRAQRMFAVGKETKGKRLMKVLDRLPQFKNFEEIEGNTLTFIANKVRGKEH